MITIEQALALFIVLTVLNLFILAINWKLKRIFNPAVSSKQKLNVMQVDALPLCPNCQNPTNIDALANWSRCGTCMEYESGSHGM